MKTPEDEAFENIERKQGGGFPAKRQMAADKLHWSDCAVHNGPAYPAGPCDCGVMNDRQRLEAIVSVVCKYLPPDGTPIKEAMSEIIGLVDPLPAQEPKREWVGLTDEERNKILMSDKPSWERHIAEEIEAKLKEKNFD
jgi:hypothetical protein